MRHSVNKRRSARKFNAKTRRTRGENHAIMRGGWRL